MSLQQYKQIKVIGRGSFGRAILVKRLTDGHKLVIKQLPVHELDENEQASAHQEVMVLSMLKHPFIVGFHDSFVEQNLLNIVIDYADGGDLHDLIQRAQQQPGPPESKLLDEDFILDLFSQIMLAIDYCHEKKILHRDLKSQNIFLTSDGHVKIGDFGIAKILNSDTDFARTVIGTPYYLSPELCEDKKYNHKSDIWALGCILYELTTLHHAFDGNNLPALILKIIRGVYPPIDDRYSIDLKEMIASMLREQPDERPELSFLLKQPCLAHHVARHRAHIAECMQMEQHSLDAALSSARSRHQQDDDHESNYVEPFTVNSVTASDNQDVTSNTIVRAASPQKPEPRKDGMGLTNWMDQVFNDLNQIRSDLRAIESNGYTVDRHISVTTILIHAGGETVSAPIMSPQRAAGRPSSRQGPPPSASSAAIPPSSSSAAASSASSSSSAQPVSSNVGGAVPLAAYFEQAVAEQANQQPRNSNILPSGRNSPLLLNNNPPSNINVKAPASKAGFASPPSSNPTAAALAANKRLVAAVGLKNSPSFGQLKQIVSKAAPSSAAHNSNSPKLAGSPSSPALLSKAAISAARAGMNQFASPNNVASNPSAGPSSKPSPANPLSSPPSNSNNHRGGVGPVGLDSRQKMLQYKKEREAARQAEIAASKEHEKLFLANLKNVQSRGLRDATPKPKSSSPQPPESESSASSPVICRSNSEDNVSASSNAISPARISRPTPAKPVPSSSKSVSKNPPTESSKPVSNKPQMSLAEFKEQCRRAQQQNQVKNQDVLVEIVLPKSLQPDPMVEYRANSPSQSSASSSSLIQSNNSIAISVFSSLHPLPSSIPATSTSCASDPPHKSTAFTVSIAADSASSSELADDDAFDAEALENRIEATRQRCEEVFGQELFDKVYRTLRDLSDQQDRTIDELQSNSVLRKEHNLPKQMFPFVRYVRQLISMENLFFLGA